MSDPDPSPELLLALRGRTGEPGAAVLAEVYDELRRVASALLARERREHTLQPTALVHEAWLRLVGDDRELSADVGAHRHFVGLAARAMRQILVDHARRRGSDKRGGGLDRVALPADLPMQSADPAMLLDLEAALDQLADRSERLTRLAELRLFGGLTVPEAAAVLDVSLSTAKSDWALTKGLLTRLLRDRDAAR